MTRGKLAALAIGAMSLGSAPPGLAQSTGQWRGPEQIYATICAYCHDTGVGPALKGSHYPADHIREVVRHGQNGMPAMKPSEFSDAELARLAEMLSQAPAETGARP